MNHVLVEAGAGEEPGPYLICWLGLVSIHYFAFGFFVCCFLGGG
jgi:hypothetical protein